MIPPRVLSLAVFSTAVVAAVWWWRQRQPPPSPSGVVRREAGTDLPWIDLTQ